MGEYIKTTRGEFKLGTCEDLYYVRFDQLADIAPHAEKLAGNLEPREYLKESFGFRYRFPFPDEDKLAPGEFDEFERGVTVHAPPGFLDEIEHHDICHSCSPKGEKYGYNINLLHPCPMSKNPGKTSVGPHTRLLQIIQQKQVEGVLWTVCRCAYCGSAFRLPLEDAVKLAESISEHHKDDSLRIGIANRMLAGYRTATAEYKKPILSALISASESLA